jgi:hypothetical protein
MTYRIKDWEMLYETAETRKLENLRWVPLPNKHDGLGFRRLALQKNRSELLASWVLMLQVASKAKRGHRGALVRDGRGLDHEDLALMTGFSAEAFKQALIFFSDSRQGWLVSEGAANQPPAVPPAESPAAPADSPAITGESPAEGKGMEGSERKGMESIPAVPAGAGFDKDPSQLRAEALMKRRPSTPMSASELRAWKTGKAVVSDTDEASWELLEWWYALESDRAPYRKTDFAALLNNWHAEIEKARRNKSQLGEYGGKF